MVVNPRHEIHDKQARHHTVQHLSLQKKIRVSKPGFSIHNTSTGNHHDSKCHKYKYNAEQNFVDSLFGVHVCFRNPLFGIFRRQTLRYSNAYAIYAFLRSSRLPRTTLKTVIPYAIYVGSKFAFSSFYYHHATLQFLHGFRTVIHLAHASH